MNKILANIIVVTIISSGILSAQDFNMGSDATQGNYGWFIDNVTTIDINVGAEAPFDGQMVRWRITNAFMGGNVIMKIFRDSASSYILIDEDERTISAGSGLNVFQVDINVKQGDILGIYCPLSDMVMCKTGGLLAQHTGNTGTSLQSEFISENYTLAVDAFVEPAVNIEKYEASENFKLCQSWPNPFDDECWIPYYLYEKNNVLLNIYNIVGKHIRILADEEQLPGNYSLNWDGTDNSGCQVPSGIYFYQLQIENYSITKKIIRL